MLNLLKATLLIVGIATILMCTSCSPAKEDEPIASLNGTNISKQTLTDYIDEILGDSYRELLDSDAGLRTLADYYINRSLLLDYAKKNIDENNAILNKHGARGTDEDTMYLTALLKAEVQERVTVSEQEIQQMLNGEERTSRAAAIAKIEEAQRAKHTQALIDFVREGHSISYLL